MRNMHEKDKNRTVPDIFNNQEVSDHPKVNKLTASLCSVLNRSSYPIYFCLVLILAISTLSMEGCAKMKSTESLGHLSFSPDGKNLLFFHQLEKSDKGTLINVIDIKTGVLSAYEPPYGETWSMAKYSYDGKKITFITMPYLNGKYEMIKTQVAVMDVDGKNYRKLTNSDSFKIFPSFSHDDKRIIYCKAGAIRKSGKTPAADYDIYEINADTGKETRVTSFKFFIMSGPHYLPDDEKIIFSAYGYDHKNRERYEDEIYIIKTGQKKPELLFYSKDGLRNPLVTGDGRIYFQTQAYKPDGSGDGDQIFQYDKNGNHRRVTNIPWSKIWSLCSAEISPDGKWLAVVYGGDEKHIVIYNLEKSSSQELRIPNKPSIIINKTQ